MLSTDIVQSVRLCDRDKVLYLALGSKALYFGNRLKCSILSTDIVPSIRSKVTANLPTPSHPFPSRPRLSFSLRRSPLRRAAPTPPWPNTPSPSAPPLLAPGARPVPCGAAFQPSQLRGAAHPGRVGWLRRRGHLRRRHICGGKHARAQCGRVGAAAPSILNLPSYASTTSPSVLSLPSCA